MLFIAGIILLVCFCFNDRIEVDKQKNDAMNVSDDVAVNSTPVIIDNLVSTKLIFYHRLSSKKTINHFSVFFNITGICK